MISFRGSDIVSILAISSHAEGLFLIWLAIVDRDIENEEDLIIFDFLAEIFNLDWVSHLFPQWSGLEGRLIKMPLS